jgi:hypothetical protein
MPRICHCPGGVNAYLRNPRILLGNEENRACPFCGKPHRLWIHGTYRRTAIVPGKRGSVEIGVVRLLCAATGRTIVLLPDFCLPRRQYGPGILGILVHALAKGAKILVALKKACPKAAMVHSLAQTLRDRFLARGTTIRAYLAQKSSRFTPPEAGHTGKRYDVALLVSGLMQGFKDPVAAFSAHARLFHRFCGQGLA